MCGIAGFTGQNQERIRTMTEALRHRGPDHQEWIAENGISLGHARLSILDPRPEGNQPMWSPGKKSVITYNGEVYNYRFLREKYHLSCRTNSDTEVLLLLYELLGERFVHELSGMYAFALYDFQKKKWILARDPSGMKPLFLSFPDGKLHFASELRTLLHALPTKPALNMRSLSLYLSLQYVPGPDTLCEGISQLPRGTMLTVAEDGTQKRTPITPNTEKVHFASKRAFRREFPGLMSTAVSDHLVSDKPVGVFLSGGMDSSIVLHHMTEFASPPIRTFTVRFEASKEEDAGRINRDADLAKLTAAHYKTDHHEILFTAERCREVYAATARALDQPNADSVAMAQYVLAEEAKKSVDVVLSGAGGDELFGGYPRYRIAYILERLGPLRALLRFLPSLPKDIGQFRSGPALAARLLGRPQEELTGMVRGEWFDPACTLSLFTEHFRSVTSGDAIRTFMEVDRAIWLVDESLRLADAVTMAHGLEQRIPFLDPTIIEAARSTPGSWHVGWKRTKALLKDTYRPFLPPHLKTLSKASFFPPLAKWIRRECAPLVSESFDHPRIRELFDTDLLRNRFEQHRTRERYSLHMLSAVVQLRHWFEEVYDSPSPQ